MPTLISTDLPLCIGCYKCVRVCPVETANVTYLDGRNRLKVRIDQTRCVACGACLDICPRGARHYQDDTELLARRLEAGDAISAIIAPTIMGNTAQHKKIIRRLKDMGVRKVYSMSLGLELHVWATIRAMERRRLETSIASYCPVLVSFCESHRPDLIPRLSPVISPASALARVLKDHAGIDDDLAVVSACLAESRQVARPSDNLRYTLSFSHLLDHLMKIGGEDLGKGEADFDEVPLGLGTTSDFGGTFLDNLRYFLGPGFRGDRFYGPKALEILDEYAGAEAGSLPDFLDIVICEGGCPMGPGRILGTKRLQVNAFLHDDRRWLLGTRDRDFYLKRQARFDEMLSLDDMLQDYHPSAVVQDYVPEDRAKDAYLSLNKTTTAQKTIDCFACGARSCFEMARKVALGVNLPTNCVVLAKELIAQAGKKMADYLQLIRLIGEYMLASGLSEIDSTIEHSLMALCSSLDISRASIWRNAYDQSESPSCSLLLSFPARMQFHQNIIEPEELPGWLEALSDGEVIVRSFAELNSRERQFFSGRDLGVLAMVPIMAQGEFWGFVLIARRHDHPFTREEITVIESSIFLIISSLITATNESQAQAQAEDQLPPSIQQGS